MKGLHDLFRQSLSFLGSPSFFEHNSLLQQVSAGFDCREASKGCTVKKQTSKRYNRATAFTIVKIQIYMLTVIPFIKSFRHQPYYFFFPLLQYPASHHSSVRFFLSYQLYENHFLHEFLCLLCSPGKFLPVESRTDWIRCFQ